MELTLGTSVALVSCLYLSIVTSPAAGKCHGKWAIHACYGGNGKRSDPSLNSYPRLPPSLLHRVLISDVQQLSRMLQDQNSTPQNNDEFLPGPQEDEVRYGKVGEADFGPQEDRGTRDLEDFGKYILRLKLRQALRGRGDDLM